MTASSQLPAPNLMPLMRYRELADAMGWLEQAFGFEKQVAVSDTDGAVIYGQMTYRGGLIMMGAVRDTDLDKLMRQPDEVGGVETQSCYLVVDDADAHYQRAVETGAEVVLELKSDGLGRRGYSCRDPEGHIWSFGTYNPGKGLTMTVAASAEPEAIPEPPRRGRRLLMSLTGLAMLAGAGWLIAHDAGEITSRIAAAAGQQASAEAARAYAELVKVRSEKRQADERAAALAAQLKTEQRKIQQAQAVAPAATATADPAVTQSLAQEKAAREAAEKALASLRDELRREQAARDDAVEAKRVLEEKLAAQSSPAPPAPAASQSTDAASPPPAAVADQPPAGANGIETSATTPKAEEPTAAAATEPEGSKDDDEAQPATATSKAVPEPKRERSSKAQRSRRADAAVSRRYPSYNTDMRNVWPYENWSH